MTMLAVISGMLLVSNLSLASGRPLRADRTWLVSRAAAIAIAGGG
jgi:hypothetical protein